MPKSQRTFKKATAPNARTMEVGKKKQEVNPLRRTPEYRAFRADMIGANPICARSDCNKATTDIHHMERITDNPDRVLDPSNIICLCGECHDLVESAVNRGIDPEIWKHLFTGME